MYTTHDVILQATGSFEFPFESFLEQRPVEEDFHLCPGVRIGGLPDGVSVSQIMDACDPAEYNFRPTRQFGAHYSFVRTLEQTSFASSNWDEDKTLAIILFLSRLIHPTTISRHYSARVIFEDGKLESIIPGQVRGFATQVWLVANSWRDYLTQEEAQCLKDAIPNYNREAPERIRRARGHLDHSFHSYYLDQKIASLVSAFESLLKIGRHGATKQFVTGSRNLGLSFGESITEDAAERFYDDRSCYVHGVGLTYTNIDIEVIERFQLFERTLRLALLKASTDISFARIFEQDSEILKTFGM